MSKTIDYFDRYTDKLYRIELNHGVVVEASYCWPETLPKQTWYDCTESDYEYLLTNPWESEQ